MILETGLKIMPITKLLKIIFDENGQFLYKI